MRRHKAPSGNHGGRIFSLKTGSHPLKIVTGTGRDFCIIIGSQRRDIRHTLRKALNYVQSFSTKHM